MSTVNCIDHGCKGYGMGYATAWVRVNGRLCSTTLHRKVHYLNTGEWPEVVRHTCDNPRCINPEHLLSGTHYDNARDCTERGRRGDCANYGTDNGRCVLSDEAVAEIRRTYVKGSRECGAPALAAKFGCGTSQIHRIVKRMQRA